MSTAAGPLQTIVPLTCLAQLSGDILPLDFVIRSLDPRHTQRGLHGESGANDHP